MELLEPMERLDPVRSEAIESFDLGSGQALSRVGASELFEPTGTVPISRSIVSAAICSRVGFGLQFRVIFLLKGDFMKIQASFVQDGKWWVAWTDDVPGALTQGASLEEARENLIDAVRMMRQPVDLSKLPKNKIVIEQLEV